MNTTIKVIPSTDELMDEYNFLAMQNDIQDMAHYAAAWKLLALKASADNRPALAAHADAHAEHYKQYDEGGYIKLVEGSIAELFLFAPRGQE